MARQFALTVDVKKFDEKEAYNHDRQISSLIRTQLLHLHVAENLWLPKKERTGININDLHTERKASEYIAKVTALLRRHGKRAAAEESRTKKKVAQRITRAPKARGYKSAKAKVHKKRASQK
jgi:hypothetical protein